MDTKEFIYKHVARRGCIGRRINKWEYWVFEELAKLTKHLGYNCNFDEKGLCEVERIKIEKYPQYRAASPKCCCEGCLRTLGYIHQLPNDLDRINQIAGYFDEKDGFWSEKGCRLPRKFRSPVCLCFACSNHEFTKAERFLVGCIGNGKRGNMTVNGYHCQYERQVPQKIEAWLKEEKRGKNS